MVNNVNTLIGICVNQQQCKHVSVSFSRAAMFMSVLPELQGYVRSCQVSCGWQIAKEGPVGADCSEAHESETVLL